MSERTVYFTMVEWPRGTVKRCGNAYAHRSTAESWLPIVSGSYNGAPSFVEACTVVLVDGKPDADSLRMLDERYNLDPPEVSHV